MSVLDRKNDRDKVELLAEQAKKQDPLAFVELLGVFSPFINYQATKCQLPISEFDDLCQDGRIALFRAVNTFDSHRNASFTTYARACIKNAMRSFVRQYCTNNQLVFHEVSLDDLSSDILPTDEKSTPESFYLAKECLEDIQSVMKKDLSQVERTVLEYKLKGLGVREISVMMGAETKSVENTLFRARKKLKKHLESTAK